jgi:DNA-binding NarL/FixJ family response regulator
VTPRERDVLEALVTGASTREIAKQLVISEYAVRYHLRNLFQKLEVHSRSQLVARVLQSGLGRSPQT